MFAFHQKLVAYLVALSTGLATGLAASGAVAGDVTGLAAAVACLGVLRALGAVTAYREKLAMDSGHVGRQWLTHVAFTWSRGRRCQFVTFPRFASEPGTYHRSCSYKTESVSNLSCMRAGLYVDGMKRTT